ncbi:hypothetical protein D9M68_705640 [compost metagenome]
MARQVGAQHVDDEGGRLLGGEHRDLRPLAHGQECVGRGLPVGHHEHRWLQRHDARHTTAVVVIAGTGQVGHLAFAKHLNPVGMDVVEVTDQIGPRARLTDRDLVEPPLRGPKPRDPLPLEGIPVVFE